MKAIDREYPLELRAQVVAAILAGGGISDTAKRYGVLKQTASRWVKEAKDPRPERSTSVDAERLESLIFGLVEDQIATLRAQMEATSRPEWLAKQTAAEMAPLLTAEREILLRVLAGFKPIAPPERAPENDDSTLVIAELGPVTSEPMSQA